MTDYDTILNDYLSHYYQATIMGISKWGSPSTIVDEYVILGTNDPEYLIAANMKLNKVTGIDDEKCVISKNNREFLQKVVSAKGAVS